MFVNNMRDIYKNILHCKKIGKKLFAILIDPDKVNNKSLNLIIKQANQNNIDYFFVGGSLLSQNKLDECISLIKENSNIPIISFPGDSMQVNSKADAILFISLISGRNPDMLIGKQVITAPLIKEYNLESISTGYMLIDSGKPTSASYISNTTPIPHDKNDIAVCQPREKYKAMMHTKQNIANRLYSADIKTIAPRCISSPISLTRPSPSVEDFTFN